MNIKSVHEGMKYYSIRYSKSSKEIYETRRITTKLFRSQSSTHVRHASL